MAWRMRALLLAEVGCSTTCAVGAVDDERHGVAFVELLDQHVERALREAESLVAVHAARDVEREDEVRALAVRRAHLLALHSEVQQVVALAVRRWKQLGLHRERRVLGRAVPVRERVHELFDAHCVFGRQRAAFERSARQRVAGWCRRRRRRC